MSAELTARSWGRDLDREFAAIRREIGSGGNPHIPGEYSPYFRWGSASGHGNGESPVTPFGPRGLFKAVYSLPEARTKGLLAPKGTIILQDGRFFLAEKKSAFEEALYDKWTYPGQTIESHVGGLHFMGFNTGFSGGAVVERLGNNGPAFHIETPGHGSGHHTRFSDFCIRLPESSDHACVDWDPGFETVAKGMQTFGGGAGWKISSGTTNAHFLHCAASRHSRSDRSGGFVVVEPNNPIDDPHGDPDIDSTAVVISIRDAQIDTSDRILAGRFGRSGHVTIDTVKLEAAAKWKGKNFHDLVEWRIKSEFPESGRNMGLKLSGIHLNVAYPVPVLVKQHGGRMPIKAKIEMINSGGRPAWTRRWMDWNNDAGDDFDALAVGWDSTQWRQKQWALGQ